MAEKDINQLDEVKADGEDSTTMDPVVPAGGSPKGKNRKADKNITVDAKADEIEDDVKTPEGDAHGDVSPAVKKGTGKKAPARLADKKAMGEAVDEMFDGQDLSEDFKNKASVIFEAAVNAHLADETERLEEEFAERLEEEKTSIMETMTVNLDKYLDYVAEKWMEENALEVEAGIKSEMAEAFMSSVFELYQEHNVTLPEEGENVLDEMVETIEELEKRLDESLNDNMKLAAIIEEAEQENIIEEICEGLTATQVEKMVKLAEGVDFETIDSYREKLEIIKENYFTKSKKTVSEETETDPIDLQEEKTYVGDPSVSRYAAALSKTLRK